MQQSTLNHHRQAAANLFPPNMIGLMEWSGECLPPFLDEGEISVGRPSILVSAPRTIGDLVNRGGAGSHDERFYVFRVTAHNGKVVARTVTRAIVNPAKVAERHAKRHG